MPDNFHPANPSNPVADYHADDLYAYLARHGLEKPSRPPFEYSNLGFGVLGQALANHAGIPYPQLLEREITGPLGMEDTVVVLSPQQKTRFIQGHGARQHLVDGWDMDALAGAGAIRSTAGDMLNYLEAQLHPEHLSGDALLAPAIADSHRIREDVASRMRIALAWLWSDDNGTYWHNGGTGGYSSYTFFHPKGDYAAVILVNQSPGVTGLADLLGEHIRERMAGEPALSLDRVFVPDGGGFFGLLRIFCSYWGTMFAAGAFIYCCVLALQGMTAQLLPRRWFLRLSSFLQLASFFALFGGYMLQPTLVTPVTIVEAQNHGPLYWSPSYWFLGLLQQLNGSPALAPLARRAWIGIAGAIALTALAYVLSYYRTLRKIVEEPDIAPGSLRVNWLPRFGKPLVTAITHFSIRTLLRSRQHRLILAFYWGIAVAFVVFNTKTPRLEQQLGTGDHPWLHANIPLLIDSILMLCAAIGAMRVVLSMPLELKANWIFQTTPVPGGARAMSAIRRAVYLLGPIPVWCASAILFFWLWPWRDAAAHMAVLLLLGAGLTELSLAGFHKIPFTCSYLPGKSRFNMAVLVYIGVVFLIVKGAELELRALGDVAGFAAMMMILTLVAVAAWRWTSALAGSEDAVLRFEERESPAIMALNLHRDGTPPA